MLCCYANLKIVFFLHHPEIKLSRSTIFHVSNIINTLMTRHALRVSGLISHNSTKFVWVSPWNLKTGDDLGGLEIYLIKRDNFDRLDITYQIYNMECVQTRFTPCSPIWTWICRVLVWAKCVRCPCGAVEGLRGKQIHCFFLLLFLFLLFLSNLLLFSQKGLS